MFARHAKTRFIAAHFAYHAYDLRAGALLDKLPNVPRSRLSYDFGRQPRTAAAFFTKYQNRILFGKDTYAPSGVPILLACLRDLDEHFVLPRLPRVLEAMGWICPTSC